jgi:hypothetical protein
MSVAHSECVYVALVIQRKMRMRLTILSSWPAQLYHIFPNYLINATIFGKRVFDMKFVLRFSLQNFSETFLILKNI